MFRSLHDHHQGYQYIYIYIYVCTSLRTVHFCCLILWLFNWCCYALGFFFCVHCTSIGYDVGWQHRLNNHKIKQQKWTVRSEVHTYIYIDTPDDGHVVTETYVGYHWVTICFNSAVVGRLVIPITIMHGEQKIKLPSEFSVWFILVQCNSLLYNNLKCNDFIKHSS
jgi:hypothetical protein